MARQAAGQGDVGFALVMFALLAIILVPLPTPVLDVLLATSIGTSILLFLATLYTKKPVDFSAFPTLLLITTMFRLALNIASTRLILLNESGDTHGAGAVIEAFGQFVVGGNPVVGLVVFAILVVINFVVITKGSGRVAEVAARFTLDAMPGKQMAVDAELNAGVIDEATARRRREEIAREADFYGAMDGASKFIRGDAIAGLIITAVNILGGVVIGTLQHGMTIGAAFQTYAILTIGDGLAGQVPALVISLAAGLLVTRVQDAHEGTLPNQIIRQLLDEPKIWLIAAGAILSLAMVPGMFLPFGGVALALAWVGWGIPNLVPPESDPAPGEPAAPGSPPRTTRPEDLLDVEPLALELGVDLLYLADESQGGELISRVQRIREQFARELGVVLPPMNLRDNVRNGATEYVVLLRGEEVARGELHARKHLALDPGGAHGKLKGVAAKDPVFGLDGFWIAENQMLKAQAQGYTVVDAPTVLTTHLIEILHLHAHELFDSTQLNKVIERVSAENARLIDDLVPSPLPRHAVLKVFRNLVREGLSTRDAVTIFEALAEYGPRTQDPDTLTEFVRQRLARHITRKFTAPDGAIHYVTLGPRAEDVVLRALQQQDGAHLILDPPVARTLLMEVQHLTQTYSGPGTPVVLVPPLARGALRRMIERVLPRVAVISSAELLPSAKLESAGTIDLRAA